MPKGKRKKKKKRNTRKVSLDCYEEIPRLVEHEDVNYGKLQRLIAMRKTTNAKFARDLGYVSFKKLNTANYSHIISLTHNIIHQVFTEIPEISWIFGHRMCVTFPTERIVSRVSRYRKHVSSRSLYKNCLLQSSQEYRVKR